MCSSDLVERLPEFPDHCETIEEASAEYPFRLATSPARTFLNSSFNETPSSRKREGRPTVLVHPDDLTSLRIADGGRVQVVHRQAGGDVGEGQRPFRRG